MERKIISNSNAICKNCTHAYVCVNGLRCSVRKRLVEYDEVPVCDWEDFEDIEP